MVFSVLSCRAYLLPYLGQGMEAGCSKYRVEVGQGICPGIPDYRQGVVRGKNVRPATAAIVLTIVADRIIAFGIAA